MVDFLSYHVNANPKASSTKRPAKVQNDPAIGIYAAISPSESIVRMTIQPTMRYAINIEAGPPVARDFPVPRKRPVPIVLTKVKTWFLVIIPGKSYPPIAIICTWRADSLRASLSAFLGWSGVEVASTSTFVASFPSSSLLVVEKVIDPSVNA